MSDREAPAPRRGRPIVLVAAFLVPFVLAFAAAYVVRSNGTDDAAGPSVVATTTVPDTTVPDTLLVPSTTVVDTTVPDTSVPDTTPDTTAGRPIPDLSSSGAFLTGPGTPDRRLPDPNLDCGIEGTDAASSCDVFAAGSLDLAWVVTTADDGSRVFQVFQRAGAAGEQIWSLVLQSAGGDYRVRVVDVTGDGNDDLVVGRHLGDADATLQVDVVDASSGDARVSLHRSLIAGSARVSDGQVDLWNGVYGPGDAKGSPSTFDHWVVQRSRGAWAVVPPVESDPAGSVPPSQL